MRILVCAPYSPYPAVGGGRADIWRRIRAFVALGHSVMLLHQYDPRGMIAFSEVHAAEMDRVVDARYSFPVRRSVKRVAVQAFRLTRLPLWVSKAVPDDAVLDEADRAVRDFAPDLVWADGPWLGELAKRYSDEFHVPLVYRSHNVEHVYLRRQASASARVRNKVVWTLAAVGVRRYELQMMARAQRVADISLDDLDYWKGHGVTGRWLPPLPEIALVDPPAERVPGDVVFVGGLSLPNNVTGLRWLIEDVLPRVHESDPGVVLSVVGYGANAELRDELESHPAVRLYSDVASVYPHLFGARVLVNPVAVGSGVQLKMLDMLMTDAPIVTRSQGARGLPPQCVEQVDVADTAELFAARILEALGAEGKADEGRAECRAMFSLSSVDDIIADFDPGAGRSQDKTGGSLP